MEIATRIEGCPYLMHLLSYTWPWKLKLIKHKIAFLILNLNTVCYCKVLEHRVLNGFDLYFWHLTQPADHKASQRLCLQANLKQIFSAVHGPVSPHCSSTCFTLSTMPTLPEDKGQSKEAQHNSSPPAKVSTLTKVFSDTCWKPEAETCLCIFRSLLNKIKSLLCISGFWLIDEVMNDLSIDILRILQIFYRLRNDNWSCSCTCLSIWSGGLYVCLC